VIIRVIPHVAPAGGDAAGRERRFDLAIGGHAPSLPAHRWVGRVLSGAVVLGSVAGVSALAPRHVRRFM
jgi:hypothetical protein